MTAFEWVAATGAAGVVVLAAWALDVAAPPDPDGRPPRRRRPRRAGDPRVGTAVSMAVGPTVALVFGPGPALVSAGLLVFLRARLKRAERARFERSVERALPDLIDLLAIAAATGQSVPSCLESVAPRAPAVLRTPLVRAHRRTKRGEPLAAALAVAGPELGHLGPMLMEAMVSAHHTGAPLRPALLRVSEMARDRRRRHAESAARRLPVTLLFPLVCCVLPAFVLLAVVPLLAVSLDSLQP